MSDVVYPFNIGARERRLREITHRLKMAWVGVHIYIMKWWDDEDTLDFSGVQLYAICKHRPLYRGERRSIMQALMFGLATFKLIAARFDVLDVDHMPYFSLFAARIICASRRNRMMMATAHEVFARVLMALQPDRLSGRKTRDVATSLALISTSL